MNTQETLQVARYEIRSTDEGFGPITCQSLQQVNEVIADCRERFPRETFEAVAVLTI